MFKKLLTILLSLFAAAAFAAVDVNKATQADLESIKGIGPVISTKILDERKKGGPFKDWDDVIARVKGIGEGNAAKFSGDGLTVNGATFKSAPAVAGKDAKKDDKAAKAQANVEKKVEAKAETANPKSAGTKADAKADMAKTADMKADMKKTESKADKKAEAKAEKAAEKKAESSGPAATKAAASGPAKR